ncbi:MAG: murein biosynthesis integral membrane protein MurJ [Alphaproteobacteria bacterium]|nr:murein biosynthesis integral membrane protein MurJ [Alphaproteobacteria bacterium]
MSFTKNILTVSGMTLLSRLSGFVRDTMAANVLGAGPVSDAFFVALRVPNLFRSLFAEGAFSAAFVPLYSKAKIEGGQEEANEFAGRALSVLMAVLLPFTVIMILLMPWAMLVLAPGFHSRPEVYDLAVTYARITFPYLMLVSGAALLASVLNSNHRFSPGAAAPIAFNVMMIIALLLSPVIDVEPGLCMAYAVPLSALVQWIWLAGHCRKMGISPAQLWPKLTTRVKELFVRIGPGAIGAGASQINLAMSTILASLLPTGSVSWLFYADRLNQLPLGIIGIAIATTLLPILSQRVQSNDVDGARHYTTRALEFGMILGLPAAIGLGLAANEIVEVLFEHGAFTAMDTVNTAAALSAYVFGILPFILIKILSTIFFAHHDTKTPVKTAIISVVLNILFAMGLLKIMGHVGVALATSIASWANVLMLAYALWRAKLLKLDHSFAPHMFKIALSAACMALFLVGVQGALDAQLLQSSKVMDVALLGAYLVGAGIVYAAALQLTGAMRLKDLVVIIKKEKT